MLRFGERAGAQTGVQAYRIRVMHKLDILRQRCPQRNGYPGEEAMPGIPLYLIAFNRQQRLWMKGQDNHDRFNQA